MEHKPIQQLWVRFSLIISSFFLILILLPLGILFVLEQTNITSFTIDDPGDEGVTFEDVPEGLLIVTATVGAVGLGLGVLLSRGLSDPIVEVIDVVKQIGEGDLNQRIPATNHSQELKDLAEAVNKMAADLQHSETLRNNMLADISHELRTPLTVLAGQLRGSIDRVYQLGEEEMAHLYSQTQHLIRLIEDLRILAQLEANQLPLTFSAVDLALLWNEFDVNFQPLAQEKQIDLNITVSSSIPNISADPGRLRQIFSNLFTNALRHTPLGGAINVLCEQDGSYVKVTVADSGEGIAAEQLPHLFDRFYRVDESRTRDTGGSGLGLAIVRALVEAHGGAIKAYSAGLGMGSQFVVILPAS